VPPNSPRAAHATGARVAAQAKVNLFLRVLAREASGYHQLETLFQRIELADDVCVRVDASGRSLDVRGAELGPVERNLAWRAADAYAARTGWPAGFAIEIEKRIPVGGGMGGGSADAGAVLRALDALAPAPLPPRALLALAAGLGADVPFLTAEHPLALAWGRGERMLALPPLPVRDVLLARSDTGVATAEAFAWLAAGRDGGTAPEPRVLTAADFDGWERVAALAANDFEPAVLPRHAGAAAAHAALAAAGHPIVLLSGSGATVFAVADPSRSAAPVASGGPTLFRSRTAVRVAAVELSP
jgi:4-diphosphocytidyl-2-C-methyl-D-erythritol kinase